MFDYYNQENKNNNSQGNHHQSEYVDDDNNSNACDDKHNDNFQVCMIKQDKFAEKTFHTKSLTYHMFVRFLCSM